MFFFFAWCFFCSARAGEFPRNHGEFMMFLLGNSPKQLEHFSLVRQIKLVYNIYIPHSYIYIYILYGITIWLSAETVPRFRVVCASSPIAASSWPPCVSPRGSPGPPPRAQRARHRGRRRRGFGSHGPCDLDAG